MGIKLTLLSLQSVVQDTVTGGHQINTSLSAISGTRYSNWWALNSTQVIPLNISVTVEHLILQESYHEISVVYLVHDIITGEH